MVLKVFLIVLGLLTTSGCVLVGLPLAAEAVMTRGTAFSKRADPTPELGLAFEDVAFPAVDGLTLRGWFVPAENADAPAVVYAHGSGRDQRSGLPLAPWLHRAGYHVLLFSYRDHGLSDRRGTGVTYGYGESQDIDSAVRFLRDEKGIGRIAVVGYSVGGASAIISAARDRSIDAVVAMAPFACTQELWAGNRSPVIPPFVSSFTLHLVGLWKGFRESSTCPVEVVGQIAPRPLLLVHGKEDRHISYTQSRQLYDAAGEPRVLWLLDGATHETVHPEVFSERRRELLDFLDAALKGSTSNWVRAETTPEDAGVEGHRVDGPVEQGDADGCDHTGQ